MKFSHLSALLAALVFFTASSFAQNAGDASTKVDFWLPGDAGDRMDIRGKVTTLDGSPPENATYTYTWSMMNTGIWIPRFFSRMILILSTAAIRVQYFLKRVTSTARK